MQIILIFFAYCSLHRKGNTAKIQSWDKILPMVNNYHYQDIPFLNSTLA